MHNGMHIEVRKRDIRLSFRKNEEDDQHITLSTNCNEKKVPEARRSRTPSQASGAM
jgi:hypothetical protein